MIPLYKDVDYNIAKSGDKLPLQCNNCKSVFHRAKKEITYELKHKRGAIKYCCLACAAAKGQTVYIIKSQVINCSNCNTPFDKRTDQIVRTKNHFCSLSCSATYNNTHKTYDTRRSKLEVWLEQQLPVMYPSLEFHFNRKDAINGELDIYIPSLKLAFELNGLFHYEPIFGPDKLSQIQNNDERKYQACIERGIELCLIDVSSLKYFKEKNIIKYLEVIKGVIERKLAGAGGYGPLTPP